MRAHAHTCVAVGSSRFYGGRADHIGTRSPRGAPFALPSARGLRQRRHRRRAGASARRLYHAYLRDPAHGGVEVLYNLAIPGETSSSMRAADGQLYGALAAIDEPSDTRLVTLDIGGNDRLLGQCAIGFNVPSCPFTANYTAIVQSLGAALANDPGSESFQVMQYYNPASGTGTLTEVAYDFGLLGDDGRIDCAATGSRLGLNDLVACIGRDHGAEAVDGYPTFKAGGPSLMADATHPNQTGHSYLACLFEHPERAGMRTPARLRRSRRQRHRPPTPWHP